jgi:hypothetical protein
MIRPEDQLPEPPLTPEEISRIERQHRKGNAREVVTFMDNDARYRTWLAEHPRGWVLTMRRRKGRNRFGLLHRASCGSLNRAPTARYPKVCARRVASIEIWAAQRSALVNGCNLCDAWIAMTV